ncbi:Inversin-B [Nymphon striatum]|nr:Inversin-B [Nymphon striatum]
MSHSSASKARSPPPFVSVGHRRLTSSRKSATPLMIACSQGLASEVKRLLPKSPITPKDITGKAALHYCTDRQSTDCAELLLQFDRSVIDFQDDEGYTALHLAVINGNIPVARLLLSKRADCNIVDKEKHSIVHWATVCGELECLDLLFEAGADTATADIHGAYPLHYAAQMCGSNSEMGNDTEIGRIVLSKLIQYGADINAQDQDGRQPLLWAASAGYSELIPLETKQPSSEEEKDIVDPDYNFRGSSDAIVALVKAGATVTAQDKDGLNGKHASSPAHCGASKGQLETLRLLSQHDANMWARNIKGDVPLHEAIQSGRKDLVKWLLCQRRELVNLSNNDGRTSLHLAALNSNVEMCKVLMDHKAVVNPIMKNRKGNLMTPLDAAISRGNKTCAKYLQLHGGVPAAKLVEKYGIHDAVGRIFSGKPELAKDVIIPSESNSVSLDSSFDSRSTRLENGERRQDMLSREFQKHAIRESHLSVSESNKVENQDHNNGQNKSTVESKDSRKEEDNTSNEEVKSTEENTKLPEIGTDAQKKAKISGEKIEKLAENQLEVHEEEIRKEETTELGLVEKNEGEKKSTGKKGIPKSDDGEEESNDKHKVAKGTRSKKSTGKSSSDTDITVRHITVEKTFSDDNIAYKSKKRLNHLEKKISKAKKEPQEKSKVTTDDDTNGTISALSSHIGSEMSQAMGTHKDSGYSDDPEDKGISDREEMSSTTSTDCNPVRRVRKRRTKTKQKLDDRIPLTHVSTVIGTATLDNNDSPVIKLGFDDALKREKHILDNSEDVFRNKSKTQLHRRLSEENVKPKSHTCELDQPAQKTKRITTSTVKKSRRNVARESSNTSSNTSYLRHSEDPPRRKKDHQSTKENSRSSNSNELPMTVNSKSQKYLTAKYDLDEPTEAITNLSKNMRKYYQEKQIFQRLSEIKRLQIKCTRGNEQVLVKRLVDEQTKNSQMVGIKPYTGPLTLKAFEKYLYDILRDFSVSNHGKVPLLKNTSNQYKSFLLMDESFDKESDPSLCTSGTHRCNHVNDAYATYPGRWLTTNENTKPTTLPKLSPTQKQQQLISQRQYRLSANSNVASGKTRVISSSKSTPGEPVTFEIKHGAEKNIFTLPTDEISNKKKWQVTFTIGMDKNNKQLGLTKEGGGPLQN